MGAFMSSKNVFLYPAHLCVPARARERTDLSLLISHIFHGSLGITVFTTTISPAQMLTQALSYGWPRCTWPLSLPFSKNMFPWLSFFKRAMILLWRKWSGFWCLKKEDYGFYLWGPCGCTLLFIFSIESGLERENAFITFYPPSEPGRDLPQGSWVEERGGNYRLRATEGFKFHLLLPWSFWASLTHSLSLSHSSFLSPSASHPPFNHTTLQELS